MVKTRKNILYSLVYKLITLAFILPFATATVKRTFFAMKLVKKSFRQIYGIGWEINGCLIVLITHIEKDLFNTIDNGVVMNQYQCMKTRKEQL